MYAPDGEPLLTTKEAAAHCGVEPVTIRQWVHRGHLAAVGRKPAGGEAVYRRSGVVRAERITRARAGRGKLDPADLERELRDSYAREAAYV